MKGRNLHELKMVRDKDYLRKRIGVVNKWKEQYLTNGILRGKIDEVLQLHDDTYAPLDYKFALYKDRVYDTYRQQVYCYAVLIEENYDARVNKGFLVYIRSKNKLIEIEVSEKHKEMIYHTVDAVMKIISTNFYPRATKYKKRCLNCTYRNICIQ